MNNSNGLVWLGLFVIAMSIFLLPITNISSFFTALPIIYFITGVFCVGIGGILYKGAE